MYEKTEIVHKLQDVIEFQKLVINYLMQDESEMRELPCANGKSCDFPPKTFTCNDCHLRAAHLYAETKMGD